LAIGLLQLLIKTKSSVRKKTANSQCSFALRPIHELNYWDAHLD